MKRIRLIGVCLLLPFLLSAQNYEEPNVPSYQLPALLQLQNGTTVQNAAEWENLRRPELVKLFEKEIYGAIPRKFESVRFKLKKEDLIMGGHARLKLISIIISNHGIEDSLTLTLLTPISKKPCPVMVLINNRDTTNTDYTRQVKSDFWPAELVLKSGYAIAAFQVNELAPDDPKTFSSRFLRLFPEELENGTRTISTWAFGASRVMDYLETDETIDSKRVALVGHSRGGKTALWAAANDKRFAICIANCSGNSGASLARRRYGQTIAMINRSFPHWFSPKYQQYNDHEDNLPVDQHMLLALIAPRPLYITSATEDRWGDPKGMYLALVNSQPIYLYYKQMPQLPATFPGADQQIVTGNLLAFHHRTGKHDLTLYDWTNFIAFAKSHWH